MVMSNAQKQMLAWLGMAAVAVGLLWLLAPVLMPFLIGAILAYALHPAVEKLAARRVPRILAVLVVEVTAIVAALAVLLLIVPILSKELPLLKAQIPLLAEKLNHSVSPWLAQHGIQVALDVASIKAFVVKYLDANLEEWMATALSLGAHRRQLRAGDRRQCRAGAGGAVLPADGLAATGAAHAGLHPAAHARSGQRFPRRVRQRAGSVPARAVARHAGAGRRLYGSARLGGVRSGAAGRRVHRSGHLHSIPRLRPRAGAGAAGGCAAVRQPLRRRRRWR
jgi:hypothetical protein